MKRSLLLLLVLLCAAAIAAPYKRKLPRTYIFSRGQWHYNPVLNYAGRWADIPLLNDPELNQGAMGTSSHAALKAMAEIALSYGLDGLASLKGNGTPQLIQMLEKNNVPGFILLPEIYATGVGMYKAGLPLDKMRQQTDMIFLPALHSKVTLKHKGKVIISSYNADDRPAEFWKALLADYRRTDGDKFLFLPLIERPCRQAWHRWRAQWAAGRLTPEKREQLKEHMRQYTRACDGLYLACGPVKSTADRHTDIEFYREMIKMATEVLAEPEFKDKLFAIAARIGHKNATRVGYIRGSYGTWCYRETMKAALAANPDIIVIPEWDEQNENTSLRPTRANLSSFTRITRIFRGLSADLPGDDLNIPNMIVSYRKIIALGENSEYELLGLPDKNGKKSVRFVLRDPAGKVVFRSQNYLFSGKKMEEHRFTIPSEKFAAYPFLTPEVIINCQGKTTVYRDGLQYIKLEPASNCDYQYIKQPLRDILRPRKAEIKWSGTQFSVKFDAGEKLAFAEILDDNVPTCAATADGKPYWIENDKEKVFAITFQNLGLNRDFLRGKLSVAGIDGVRWMHDSTAGWPTSIGTPVTANSYDLDVRVGNEISRIMLAIPAGSINKAVLNIDIPGYFNKSLPLAQVLKVRTYGVAGKKVPVMTVARQDFQLLQVKRLKKNAISFSGTANPQCKRSTLHFQAITESGKIYRSAPIAIEAKQGRGKIRVYSEVSGKPVNLLVPASRIPCFDYRPDVNAGTAIHCDDGLRYAAVAGGYPSHHSARYGARRDSTVFISLREFPKNTVSASPAVKRGFWEFTGNGQHIALPTGVISRRAAFTLTLALCQTDASGRQTLLDNRASQPGVIKVLAQNGEVTVEIMNDKVQARTYKTGIILPKGKMVQLKVVYDLDTLTVTMGKKTFSAKCMYPGLSDCVAAVGGGKEGSFKGRIARVSVDYAR